MKVQIKMSVCQLKLFFYTVTKTCNQIIIDIDHDKFDKKGSYQGINYCIIMYVHELIDSIAHNVLS